MMELPIIDIYHKVVIVVEDKDGKGGGYEIVEKSLEEQVAENLITPQEADRINAEREIDQLQDYLKKTDWYTTRFSETGKPIPEEISVERQTTRIRISELRVAIKESENIQWRI